LFRLALFADPLFQENIQMTEKSQQDEMLTHDHRTELRSFNRTKALDEKAYVIFFFYLLFKTPDARPPARGSFFVARGPPFLFPPFFA
jgi:hypothetical protein